MYVLLLAFVLKLPSIIAATSQHSFQEAVQFGVASNNSLRNPSCSNFDKFLAFEQACPSDAAPPDPSAQRRALEDVLYRKGPWTSKPHCIPQDRSSGDPDPEPLCIFNDNKFANNRGISIISTPHVVHEILNSEAYTRPLLPEEGVNAETNPPFYLMPMEGRGIGAVANRTLHRGDRIFSYTPVLILHRDALDQYALQNEAVNRLPEYARNVFLALHGHFGLDKVHDIILTNSFSVYLGEKEETHNAVLPETSRFNHDCRPNAHYYFDDSALIHHVHALRTIHAGEELTISYTDGTKLREERREAIELSWGFPCSCSTCSQPPILTAESDRRLRLIAKFRQHLDDYSENSIATPAMAETLVSLYEQERLIADSSLGYTYAALTHNSFGNVDQAIKYAALGIEYTMLSWGPDADDVAVMQELIENPKAHWSYKRRIKKVK